MYDLLSASPRAVWLVPLTHQNPKQASLIILNDDTSEMWKDQKLMTELKGSEVKGRCTCLLVCVGGGGVTLSLLWHTFLWPICDLSRSSEQQKHRVLFLCLTISTLYVLRKHIKVSSTFSYCSPPPHLFLFLLFIFLLLLWLCLFSPGSTSCWLTPLKTVSP